MYAVVEYQDYDDAGCIKLITTTDDLEYAKKYAFQRIKKIISNMPQGDGTEDNNIYKITNAIGTHHLQAISKTIITYRVIVVENYKKGFKLIHHHPLVYAVVEMKKHNKQNLEEIDTSLICNDYYDKYYDSEDEYEEDNDEDDDKKDDKNKE